MGIMTAAKVPASQDGPAMSVSPDRQQQPAGRPGWRGRDAMVRGGGAGARVDLPGPALRDLGFMVAHDGTRLIAWPRPAQARKATRNPPGGIRETPPGITGTPGWYVVNPAGYWNSNTAHKKELVLRAAFGDG